MQGPKEQLKGVGKKGEPLAGGKFYSVLTKSGPGGPAVTKASSFGGVSLLHRDSSLTEARNAALRAVKADSFNVSSLPTVVQAPPPVATSPTEHPPPPHVATTAPHAPRPQLYVAQLPWGAAPREAGALSLPPMWPLAGPSVLEASSLTPTGLLLNPQAVAGVPLVSPDMAGGLVQGVRPRGGPGPLGGGGLLLSPLAPPRGPVPAHPHHHQHHHHHHHPHQQQPPQQLVYLPCVQPPTSLEARKPGLLDTQEPPGCEAVTGQLSSLTLVGGESAEGAGGAGHPRGPIYYVQPAPLTTCGRNYVSSVPEAHANPQLGLAAAGPQAGALIAGSPVGGGSYPVWGYYAPPPWLALAMPTGFATSPATTPHLPAFPCGTCDRRRPPTSSAQAQQQPLVGYALCSAGPPVGPPQHPLPPMVTAFQSLVPCVATRPAVASNAAGASRASLVGPASFAVGLPACGMAKSGAPYLGMGVPTHPGATTPYGDGSPGERVASSADASSMGNNCLPIFFM
ncbi:hypothetical protein MRX96_051460 [Rhipicephalus microplus]